MCTILFMVIISLGAMLLMAMLILLVSKSNPSMSIQVLILKIKFPLLAMPPHDPTIKVMW